MYIISKHKDYYDGVVGTTGIDKTIVYERHLNEIESTKDYPKEVIQLYEDNREGYFYRSGLNAYPLKKEQKKYVAYAVFLVGFCGKIYVGWKFYREIKRFTGGVDYLVTYTYDLDFVKKYVDVMIGKNTFLQDQLDKIKNTNLIDIFREHNAPAFVYDCDWSPDNYGGNYPHKFIINPNLKELKFFKVFDAFTAFQEIMMFISGVLGVGEREIVEIEDKYKIPQHGFDKWSFRREPKPTKNRKS